ncbi:MAG: hypothetical protein EOO90_07545 [Pedobacter sp.]|nr:MAG: hypothetical protein EOO90_07545 [Pedobacter sp.]
MEFKATKQLIVRDRFKLLKVCGVLIVLFTLGVSCKKDDPVPEVEDNRVKMKSFAHNAFSYNNKNKLDTISRLVSVFFPGDLPLSSVYELSNTSSVRKLKSFFEYQKDGKVSFFNTLGNYYEYSYPTSNKTVINYSYGMVRDRVSALKFTFEITKTNGLVTLIEVFYEEAPMIKRTQYLRYIISYSGKNPDKIIKYIYSRFAKEWLLKEEYYGFVYDNFTNPIYVAFEGQPNFYFPDPWPRDGSSNNSFINLYSLSENNPLEVKVKYFDYDGLFYQDGLMKYSPKYDDENRIIQYYCENAKLGGGDRAVTYTISFPIGY